MLSATVSGEKGLSRNVGWLVGWLVGCGWLVGWWVGGLVGWVGLGWVGLVCSFACLFVVVVVN